MSLEITEDLIARPPPEAQAIIRLLLAKIAELEARLGKTPENSSLPPAGWPGHSMAGSHSDRRLRLRLGICEDMPRAGRSRLLLRNPSSLRLDGPSAP